MMNQNDGDIHNPKVATAMDKTQARMIQTSSHPKGTRPMRARDTPRNRKNTVVKIMKAMHVARRGCNASALGIVGPGTVLGMSAMVKRYSQWLQDDHQSSIDYAVRWSNRIDLGTVTRENRLANQVKILNILSRIGGANLSCAVQTLYRGRFRLLGGPFFDF